MVKICVHSSNFFVKILIRALTLKLFDLKIIIIILIYAQKAITVKEYILIF